MAFRIEERFVVKAPAGAVWAYLIDPRRVVICLPGAELTEIVDARTFHGVVKVKVGPVLVAYKGRVQLAELDEASRRVKMRGEGRETAGAGSAKMTMESVIATLPGGETEVVVHADVDVVGRAVQLGRGLLEQVSAQLFRQFSACVRATLEGEAAAAIEGPTGGEGDMGGGRAGHRPDAGREGATHGTALARNREPLRAIPLLLHALWAALGAFFRRLVGGGKRR